MAHLWSKFTKCLRSSEEAFKARACCHSRTLALRTHNAASFAIITSLLSPPRGSNGVFPSPPPPNLLSSLSIVCFSFCSSFSLLVLYEDRIHVLSRKLSIITNIMLITKCPAARLSIFLQDDISSFIYRILRWCIYDRRRMASELIAIRYLTKYGFYCLQLDFIYGFYSRSI